MESHAGHDGFQIGFTYLTRKTPDIHISLFTFHLSRTLLQPCRQNRRHLLLTEFRRTVLAVAALQDLRKIGGGDAVLPQTGNPGTFDPVIQKLRQLLAIRRD